MQSATITAENVLRSEGYVWRWTVTTEHGDMFKGLHWASAREVLELEGYDEPTATLALDTARFKGVYVK